MKYKQHIVKTEGIEGALNLFDTEGYSPVFILKAWLHGYYLIVFKQNSTVN